MTKMLRKFLVLLALMVPLVFLYAQNGIIRGRIFNAINNEPLEFATVKIQAQPFGGYTDSTGRFEIKSIPPGLYNLEVSYTGFATQVISELEVTNAKPMELEVAMKEEGSTTDTVVITTSAFNKTDESPLSLRTIGVNEVARSPGGNRDISRVIQSLPGVAGTVAFRNDIIIRGGSPNENRFFIDGVEVPNINHFSTQGASGGPVGLINVNFIREVDFFTSAFPSNRGNALSSVMDIKQKSGREDRIGLNATVGSSDIGLTVEGPIGKKTTFMVSGRRSYLGWLFKTLALPFLPNYNDFQFKTRTKISPKSELIVLGLGAIDNFALNLKADSTDQQKYILGYLPVNTQWNYTMGANFKHFFENSYLTVVASRNMLNNKSVKFQNNDESNAAGQILDYNSQEIENKLRIEHNTGKGGFKMVYGVSYEFAKYNNRTFNRISTPAGIDTVNYRTDLDLHKYGAFGNISRKLVHDRLSLALGLRVDGTTYSAKMANPLDQLSPRFSLSYIIKPRFSFNFNTGIYYQLPAYTAMGYRNSSGALINQQNGLSYIRSKHIVAGLEYNTKFNTRFTTEGFFKRYNNYPFLTQQQISLANLGGDFGVVGNAPITSTSEGRSYGVEVSAQQKLYKGFFGILSFTYVRSEFTDSSGAFRPSSWDNRAIFTSVLGKKFKRNWEIGVRWRFYGGTPYTPYDIDRSSLISVWNITGQGIPDYTKLNTLRLNPAHNLDFRVDKKWFFQKWSLNLYLDLQNAYNYQSQSVPYLDVVRDANGNAMLDPNKPGHYQLKQIENTVGTLLPSIGIVIDL
jgi:CarboxypepD_reg-like domain/TonB-dependent Receptor Plug Domain